MQPGDTPHDFGCPPEIGTANITTHPPSPSPTFAGSDWALIGALAAVILVAAAATLYVIKCKKGKHTR